MAKCWQIVVPITARDLADLLRAKVGPDELRVVVDRRRGQQRAKPSMRHQDRRRDDRRSASTKGVAVTQVRIDEKSRV